MLDHICDHHAEEHTDLLEIGNMPSCPVCGSGFAALLGILGSKVWLRCQGCGAEYQHGEDH